MTVIVRGWRWTSSSSILETLNTLATTQNEERTAKLLHDLRGYIVELKRGGIWNQNLEEVTESLLSEISEMWKSYATTPRRHLHGRGGKASHGMIPMRANILMGG
jgi:hypothetical protein